MRLLQIVPSVALVYGGPSQMILGLSAALAAQGAEVTLLTTNANGDAGQPPLDVPLAQLLPQDGYQVIYFRCSPWRRYKFSLPLLGWLARHGKSYDLAHIHALFSPVSTASAAIARFLELPYLLRPLGTLDPADLQKKRQLKQVYGWLLERPNLAGAAGVHFTSQEEAQISERFGVKTQDIVLPLGVELPVRLSHNCARQQLAIPENCPLILFMSRIDRKKGLDLLIPALEQLVAADKNFYFVLAGANPQDPGYETQIQQQIQGSILRTRTKIAGFVSGELKQALLQAADLFVLPSYYENFGIAVAEALAAGTPVVISDRVHIHPQVSAYGAGWVVPTQVADLAAQLQQALASADDRRRRGEQARRLAEDKYTWSAIAKQMLAVYETLARRR
ncbi:MAG: glycosyltransferase [Chloroflexaceae bacterium]|nr:glycosyltransferase [Chloroflexaceae bacterium]